MKLSRLKRINVYAPAVVVLATVVNAAAASDCVLAAPAPTSHDLTCVIGGGTHSVKTARTSIAKNAARTIDSLDKLNAAAVSPRSTDLLGALAVSVTPAAQFSPALNPSHSTHQHSAP
jgi:hypothetical protein